MTNVPPGAGVQNPDRLAALRALDLLDQPEDQAFDRLTRLVARILRVPAAQISLLDADRQFFASAIGLPEPWASRRETPLSHSFCQHVVDRGEVFVVDDAPRHPLVRDNLAIPDLDVQSYLGVPITTRDGMVLGSLCAIDHSPRAWSGDDVDVVRDVAASVVAEIELRRDVRARLAAEAALRTSLSQTTALYEIARALSRTQEKGAILDSIVACAAMVLPAHRAVLITIDLAGRRTLEQTEAGPGARHAAPLSFDELWEGLSGEALRQRRALLSPRGEPDPRESQAVQARRARDEAGSIIVAPIQSQGATFGTLTAINAPDGPEFTQRDLSLLAALADQAAVAIERAALLRELEQQATVDGLTRLLNRRAWLAHSQRLASLAERSRRPLSIVMLDIDHFKRVNDTHGHAVGDRVLQIVSAVLQRTARKSDLVARYGGEEFVVLLPDTGAEQASLLAKRIRTGVAAELLDSPGGPVGVTVSLGVAEYAPGQGDLDAALGRADQALYAAKRAGRNCVRVSHGDAGERA